MITLYNVIDTRTDMHHSVAIVKDQDARWFVSAEEEEAEEE